MTHPRKHSRINLDEIAARNETARHMIAGFAAEMPTLADFWRNLATALADAMTMAAEITLLDAELVSARLDMANLLAAMRASITAHTDGEPDPLYYVRDELDAQQMPAKQHGRAS